MPPKSWWPRAVSDAGEREVARDSAATVVGSAAELPVSEVVRKVASRLKARETGPGTEGVAAGAGVFVSVEVSGVSGVCEVSDGPDVSDVGGAVGMSPVTIRPKPFCSAPEPRTTSTRASSGMRTTSGRGAPFSSVIRSRSRSSCETGRTVNGRSAVGSLVVSVVDAPSVAGTARGRVRPCGTASRTVPRTPWYSGSGPISRSSGACGTGSGAPNLIRGSAPGPSYRSSVRSAGTSNTWVSWSPVLMKNWSWPTVVAVVLPSVVWPVNW